jgi:hypothetical protein
MHRVPPEKLDAEHAALVRLSLLYLVRRRLGARMEELLDGDTQSVFDELGLRTKGGRQPNEGGQQRWFEMAEMLASEDYGSRHLDTATSVGAPRRHLTEAAEPPPGVASVLRALIRMNHRATGTSLPTRRPTQNRIAMAVSGC